MSPTYAATLCAQLEGILDAGAPTRSLVKELKSIELTFRNDRELSRDVLAKMNQVVQNIRDFWTALQIPMAGRELDQVRYVARCSIQALEAAMRRPVRQSAAHGSRGFTAQPATLLR